MTRLWIFPKIITREAWDSHVIFKAHPTYFRHCIINVKWSIFSKCLSTALQCCSSEWGFLPLAYIPHCKHPAPSQVMQSPIFLMYTFLSFVLWVLSWSELHFILWVERELCVISASAKSAVQPPHCSSDLTATPNNLQHHSTITLSCKVILSPLV